MKIFYTEPNGEERVTILGCRRTFEFLLKRYAELGYQITRIEEES